MSPQNPTSIPWNPDSTSFPARKDLPKSPNAPEGAAWVWGEEDGIGRLNLLTPTRVKAAAKEINTGELVTVNLPLNVPATPSFGREKFHHEIKVLAPGIAFDDKYTMNTQSGTQWDGFRHFAHIATQTFYNGAKASDVIGPDANLKASIHHWAVHGIAARGILIDYWGYSQKIGKPYDPYGHYGISYDDLAAAGKDQGIDVRPAHKGGDVQIGDMLFIRSGFVDTYYSKTPEERDAMGNRHHTMDEENKNFFSGVKQEAAILDWIHDSYFSAVAGDAPSFECWPSAEQYFLHEYILALWGMPIGEMLDLEQLSETCRKKNRWTFFFTTAPANMPGGVASHVNGTAIF